MKWSEITEGVEEIDIGRTSTIVLRNPTRSQYARVIRQWNKARGILMIDTDTVFIADANLVYHYRMIEKLGLHDNNVVMFVGYDDRLCVYTRPESNSGKEDRDFLKASRAITRIFGADPHIGVAIPD